MLLHVSEREVWYWRMYIIIICTVCQCACAESSIITVLYTRLMIPLFYYEPVTGLPR